MVFIFYFNTIIVYHVCIYDIILYKCYVLLVLEYEMKHYL